MSTPVPPKPAKLVTGLFMKEKSLLAPVAEALSDEFGEVDIVSEWIPFDFTTYYEAEMGTPLFRRVIAFKKLIEQEDLAAIKQTTNRIEGKYTQDGKRSVNIDPGYMLQERFVLATGKNFAHRIYIGKGIYADLTLLYVKGAFQTLPWTYPDYADERMLNCLSRIRAKYREDLKWK